MLWISPRPETCTQLSSTCNPQYTKSNDGNFPNTLYLAGDTPLASMHPRKDYVLREQLTLTFPYDPIALLIIGFICSDTVQSCPFIYSHV